MKLSAFQVDRWNPGIAVRIKDDAFTKTVWLIEAACQHRKAQVSRTHFSLIRVYAKAAEFNADPAACSFAQKSMQRIVVIGIVVMDHEFAAQQFHGREFVSLKIYCGAQNACCEVHTGRKVADDQAEAQAFQALAISISRGRLELAQDVLAGWRVVASWPDQ